MVTRNRAVAEAKKPAPNPAQKHPPTLLNTAYFVRTGDIMSLVCLVQTSVI